MYRKRGTNLTVKEVLARLRGEEECTSIPATPYIPTPVQTDALAAKKILKHLLRNMIALPEVSSIQETLTELTEA